MGKSMRPVWGRSLGDPRGGERRAGVGQGGLVSKIRQRSGCPVETRSAGVSRGHFPGFQVLQKTTAAWMALDGGTLGHIHLRASCFIRVTGTEDPLQGREVGGETVQKWKESQRRSSF